MLELVSQRTECGFQDAQRSTGVQKAKAKGAQARESVCKRRGGSRRQGARRSKAAAEAQADVVRKRVRTPLNTKPPKTSRHSGGDS